jgi:hypothetical protein
VYNIQQHMKIRNAIITLTCRSLYESLGTDMMVRLVRIILPGYDINRATGIPDNIPITGQVAAEQIVRDVIARDRFLAFVEAIVNVDANGSMGREYRIHRLSELVKAILAEGFVFDRGTGLFMENSAERASPNWGRLSEGEEKNFAFLKLDIAKNSKLVKSNEKAKVEAAYAGLRSLVSRSVLARAGRVWSWEGDGCLCAFLFNQKERSALLSGIEILNELYFYNRTGNPLSSPIKVRLAAHCGPLRYSADPVSIKKAEVIREISDFESKHTETDCLTVSPNLFLGVDQVIQGRFGPEKTCDGFKLRSYSIRLEDA